MTTDMVAGRVARTMLAIALLLGSAPLAAQSRILIGSGFHAPQGVVVDASGDVFVADTGSGEVKEILAPNYTTTVPIAALNGHFTQPTAIAIDGAGNLFVADFGDGTVKEISAASSYITVSTIAIGLSIPTGIAVDSEDNVFVADNGSNHLYELLAATNYATRVTLTSSFAALSGVAVDAKGNLFTADQNDGIQEIPAQGGYRTIINLASGNQNIVQPFGIGLDGAGNIFFTDLALGQLAEISIASGYQTVIPRLGALNEPNGVSVDGKGNVFIAEPNNNLGAVDELVAATTTGVTSSLNPSSLGEGVTLTATVATSAGVPTGTVTFYDGANAMGTSALTGDSAGFTALSLGLGSHAITAHYDGDANYAGSVSSALTQAVNTAATTTTAIASSQDPTHFGQAVTFTATVSGQSPTGTVTFQDGMTTICAGVALSNATAQCATSTMTLGAHAITAMYSGDAGNLASASFGIVQTIQVAPTTTTLSTACERTFVESQPYTFSAFVSGLSPIGNVTFANGSDVLCANIPLSAGSATCTTTALSTAGSDLEDRLNLIASYAGDSNHMPSTSSALTVTVLNAGDVVYRNGFEAESASCPIE